MPFAPSTDLETLKSEPDLGERLPKQSWAVAAAGSHSIWKITRPLLLQLVLHTLVLVLHFCSLEHSSYTACSKNK